MRFSDLSAYPAIVTQAEKAPLEMIQSVGFWNWWKSLLPIICRHKIDAPFPGETIGR